jgi:hypothetical protein
MIGSLVEEGSHSHRQRTDAFEQTVGEDFCVKSKGIQQFESEDFVDIVIWKNYDPHEEGRNQLSLDDGTILIVKEAYPEPLRSCFTASTKNESASSLSRVSRRWWCPSDSA